MKESEATSKWCPFVRVIMLADGGKFVGPANRAVGLDGVEGNKGARCIGSDCMAWRWEVPGTEGRSPPGEAEGHCGLAGRE